ncbi:hypothetical protein T31B1_11043 [Salinisphaera sp. T31B1]
MISNNELHPQALAAFLRQMGTKYCAGTPAAGSMRREWITTRVMVSGTYRDVCELIDLSGRDYLVYVFTSVPRAWFTAAARQYWMRHLELVPADVGRRSPAVARPRDTHRSMIGGHRNRQPSVTR